MLHSNGERRPPMQEDAAEKAAMTVTSITRHRIWRVTARRPGWASTTPTRTRYLVTLYDAQRLAARLRADHWSVTVAVSDVTVTFQAVNA